MNRIDYVMWNLAARNGTLVSESVRRSRGHVSLQKRRIALLVGWVIQGTAMATTYTSPVVVSGGASRTLENDTVNVSASNVNTMAAVGAGSQLTANNVTDIASGSNSRGAASINGGVVSINGGSITTTGSTGLAASAFSGSNISITNATLSTSGLNAYGVLTQEGSSATVSGGSVITQGGGAIGLIAYGAGSKLSAADVQIKTTGAGAQGVAANQGGALSIHGGSITTTGREGVAAIVPGGSNISITNANLSTSGLNAYGVEVLGGSSTISGGHVMTEGAGAAGLYAVGAGSKLSAENIQIKTTGAGASGVFAQKEGVLSIEGGSITTTGSQSTAATAFGGSSIRMTNATLSTSGLNARGVVAQGGSATVSGGSVMTQGAEALGLFVGKAGKLSAENVLIKTTGANAYGVAAQDGGVLSIEGGSITTTGSQSAAAIAFSDSNIRMTNAAVSTSGDEAPGVAVQGGSATVSGASVMTQGAGAPGLLAYGAGSQLSVANVSIKTTGPDLAMGATGATVLQGGQITLGSGTSISTTGPSAWGLYAAGTNSLLTTSDQVSVNTLGATADGVRAVDGGRLTLGPGTTITTVGSDARGLAALGTGSQVNATGVSVTTQGAYADGVSISNSAVTLTNSKIIGQRNGVMLSKDNSAQSTNTLTISGGSVTATTGDAIYADGGTSTVNVSNSAKVTGGHGGLLQLVNTNNTKTTVYLHATDHAILNGNITAAASTIADVSLAQGSVLTGAMQNANNVSVDGTSVWNIRGNSDVRQLMLAGTAAFTAPTAGRQTLTVHGNLVGNGGTVVLHTVLNAGGALSNQFSDRLLVEGDANGTTNLKINSTGSGALTDVNKNSVPDPNEGISVAQVAGQASASTFALQGGYVAVGPWRYQLYASQPGSSDPGQRLVSGSGNNYWDYRLQNVYVARPAVVPQVPAYLSAPTAMLSYSMRNLSTLHDRLGELHQDDVRGGEGNTNEFNARIFGGSYRYTSNLGFNQYGYNFEQNDRAIQIGGTWLKVDAHQTTWRMGLYGSVGTSVIMPNAVDGRSRLRISDYSLAATVTYVHTGGFYVDGIVARNHYHTFVDTDDRGSNIGDFHSQGWSYSLESGYPFVFGNGLRVEPQAQVIYQSLHTGMFNDNDELTVTSGSSNGWIGRIGANLSKTLISASRYRWTPWMHLNYLTSSSGSAAVDITSEVWGVNRVFATGRWGSAVQLGTGVTGSMSKAVSLYGGVDYQTAVGSAGEKGWSANLGLRWRF